MRRSCEAVEPAGAERGDGVGDPPVEPIERPRIDTHPDAPGHDDGDEQDQPDPARGTDLLRERRSRARGPATPVCPGSRIGRRRHDLATLFHASLHTDPRMIGLGPGAVADPRARRRPLSERAKAQERMLARHRRAFVWSLILLGGCVASLFAVGRHEPALAPVTTVPFIGRFDLSVYHWVDDIRNTPLTWICRVLNVIGGGIVTIPLRIVVTAYLLFRRRWLRATAFAATWAVSEIALTWLKDYFHRGRPFEPLVAVNGYSF